MSFEDYTKEKLWSILVETVHSIVMYPHHRAFTKDVIIQEKPETTPQELASRLGISLGEALVIVYELAGEAKTKS